MPDDNMMGFEWIILCYYGGRCEKVEANDEGVIRYLRDLLSNPRKAHPDIEDDLTHVRIYKRVADFPAPQEYVKGIATKIEDVLKSLYADDRAGEESTLGLWMKKS